MGAIRTFGPVKLFTGVLAESASALEEVEARLTEEHGPVDLRSPVIPFTFTDYYKRETGDHIVRLFLSFEQLTDASQLAAIKKRTNDIEAEFASRSLTVSRPINLDPGYLENSKVVLASTKNFYHRMYLGDGIFAEVTMYFKNGSWEFFPWTYPDYQSQQYLAYFSDLRKRYREQLKTFCLLKQREN